MFLVGITISLILVGVGFFAYGAIGLSRYAFRLGTGPGLLTLLFPPYTFYFAIFKLEEEGKSWPTASWLFGIVVATMLTVAFWPDLSAVMRGDMERFEEPSSPGEVAVEEYGDNESDEEDEPAAEDDDAEPEEEGEDGEAAQGEDGEAAQGEDGEAAQGEDGEAAQEEGVEEDE